MIRREIHALQRIAKEVAQKNAFQVMFGGGLLGSIPGDYVESRLFDIAPKDGLLSATINIYDALWPEVAPRDFDVDKWTDMHFTISGPVARDTYRELSTVCRALLAGRYAAITGPSGIYCMDLKDGVTFIPREDDGQAYPKPQSWEKFLGVDADPTCKSVINGRGNHA